MLRGQAMHPTIAQRFSAVARCVIYRNAAPYLLLRQKRSRCHSKAAGSPTDAPETPPDLEAPCLIGAPRPGAILAVYAASAIPSATLDDPDDDPIFWARQRLDLAPSNNRALCAEA